MFGLILGIITVLIGIGAGVYCYTGYTKSKVANEDGYGYKKDNYGNYIYETKYPFRKFTALSIVVSILIAAIIIGFSCIHSVPTGHTGVVTSFGKVENYTLDAGIHFMKPWAKVIKMDNRVQKNTVPLPCFSSDIQEVNIAYTINYQINKTNAMNIYKSVGTSYYDIIIAPNITEAVKEVTALYTAESLVNSREELSNKIEAVLTERLAKYDIQVVSTSIEDMDFTDAFTNAVEAKQVAQQNKLKAETVAAQKVVEAEADAKVKTVEATAKAEADKIAADAEAYQIKVKAEAEAEANKKISESLTNTLIDYEYAQSWDGKYPTYVSGDNGFIPVINK
jgi:regulator of protease activity HflC (stomatin/prohibitin superfamily)